MSVLGHHGDSVRAALAAEKERVGRSTRVDETAFLPAALEIVERPVSPTARLTARILLIGVVIAILWLVIGRVDIVASAQGKIIPADAVKLVQPAETGVVRAILVTDNQHVRKGQPLVVLDPTVSAAEASQAREALQTSELDAARSRAVLSALDGHGLVFNAPPGTPPEVIDVQKQLARAQLDNIRGADAMHNGEMQAASAAKAEASVQVAKLTETLPLLDVQIDAYEKLLAKGFVSRLRVIEMHRQRLAAEKDRDTALETMRKASAQIRAASGSLEQANGDARMQVLQNLAKSEAEASLRREELNKAVQKSSFQTLASSVDGTVTQLSVHTVGGVVEAAKPIMAIVPAGGPLVAEVKILNKDIGFVRVGQPVAVKLAAFPFTRYGTVVGRVDSLSSDAVQDEKLGLVYTGRVAIGRDMIQRSGETVALTPGMEVTADIRTGRRNILSYVLSPIDETRQDAARER